MEVIGFTDEEISQLNDKGDHSSANQCNHSPIAPDNHKQNNPHKARPKQTTIRSSAGQRRERVSKPAAKHDTAGLGNIKGAYLYKPVEADPYDSKPQRENSHPDLTQRSREVRDNDVTTDNQSTALPSNDTIIDDENPFKPDISPVESTEQSTEVVADSDNVTDIECQEDVSQLTKLEQLQMAQAKLETENKQKQAELRQTITEKFAKTSEQARLLRTLQEEVASLEREMSCDISILRDRIDESNRKYFEARQRHERAEQEFVASKLDMYNCQQLKEGLEEHLFTIIQLNETKKSEKLQELHNKLQKLSLE